MSDFKSQLSSLLSFCTTDAEGVADAICQNYSDFSLLAQTDRSVLASLCGERCADMIRILASVNSRRITDRFKFGVKHTEQELYEFLIGYYFDQPCETVIALPLNSRGHILAVHTLLEGTVNFSEVLPRKLLEVMVKHNSTSVIIAHNHPRGSARASEEDMLTTQKLDFMLSAADKRLVCHYIVAHGEVACVMPLSEKSDK
ncbi:MAG: JAB domain-containing protein [Clostridia bacterium]|nr:JAB domain-containing protein [Clostridia bacterium]